METLKLYTVGQEQEHSTELHVVSRQPIGDPKDTYEEIQRVKGYIEGDGRTKDVSLVSKIPLYVHHFGPLLPGEKFDPVEAYCFVWTGLKRSKLPVAPTLRKVPDTGEVMMTDFTTHGGQLYDKLSSLDLIHKKRAPAPTDHIFVGLDLDIVKAKAREIIDRATELRISLASDDAFNLVVYPTGKWHLVSLDIGFTRFLDDRAAQKNESGLSTFMLHMQSMQDLLLNPIQTT